MDIDTEFYADLGRNGADLWVPKGVSRCNYDRELWDKSFRERKLSGKEGFLIRYLSIPVFPSFPRRKKVCRFPPRVRFIHREIPIRFRFRFAKVTSLRAIAHYRIPGLAGNKF